MKFILGKKIDMTQTWRGEDVVAVTKVQVGPCVVSQVKNEKQDGYSSVQIGYGEKKEKNINKPQRGHFKDLGNFRYVKEFRIKKEGDVSKDIARGDVIKIDTFAVGDVVDVIGFSKGKGFQGVVKRHGFAGSKKTHGNKDQLRMPGSIGATGPAHVFKGMRMGGRMGGDRVTVANLEVVEIDVENNIISIKGALPGARNGLIMISGAGDLKISKQEEVKEEITEGVENKEVKNEEAKDETPVEEVKIEDESKK